MCHLGITTKMEPDQGILKDKGYRPDKATDQKEFPVVAIKGDEKFLIKKVILHQVRLLDLIFN